MLSQPPSTKPSNNKRQVGFGGAPGPLEGSWLHLTRVKLGLYQHIWDSRQTLSVVLRLSESRIPDCHVFSPTKDLELALDWGHAGLGKVKTTFLPIALFAS
eukprot:3024121-Amphidinium_carterae.1